MAGNRYTQIVELGQSSRMSRLYKAFDTQEQQSVVIKVMKGKPYDPLQDQKLRKMFQQETDIALSLDHVHILRAIGNGTAFVLPGQPLEPYIVYPFMRDGSLSELIKDLPSWEKWSPQQTVDVILQTASALAYMHTRLHPIIHWDVKPENILVEILQKPERIAHIYLSDFGISRSLRAHYNHTSHPWGTPSYMAPEQFDGTLDPKSDQYTLALMACFLLTGEYPLTAHHADEWKYVHQNVPPVRPSLLNPQRLQSAEVDAVILRALSKTQQQRYPTIWIFAKELADAMRRHFASTPTEKFDLVAPLPLPPSPIFIPGIVPKPIPLHPLEDFEPYELEDEASPIPPVQAPIESKKISESLPELPLKKLLTNKLPARPNMICWSHDGQYLACLFIAHPPVILDRHGTIKNISNAETGHAACWSPAAYTIAISALKILAGETYSNISIVDTMSPSVWPFAFPTFHVPIISGLDWSNKGQLALWCDSENYVRLYTLPRILSSIVKPLEPRVFSTGDMQCSDTGVLRYSPDGKLLAAGGHNGSVICWQLEQSSILWQLPATSRQVFSIAWSPDSIYLAVAFKNRRVAVWNVYKHILVTDWTDLPAVPRVLSFSRQSQLAVASGQKNLLFGTLQDPSPSAVHAGYRLVAWSPTRLEFATLEPANETRLTIWEV